MSRDTSSSKVLKRVGIVTSNPLWVAPFLSLDLESLGIEVPVAILIRPPGSMRDRLRKLAPALKRQARINRTHRWLQLIYRVLYYSVTSKKREAKFGAKVLRFAALAQLTRDRHVVETDSANDPVAVAGLRDAACDLVVVLGADVLTRETLAAIDVPLVNLHMSDPSFARGMPPVFWEIHGGRNEITLTLHRLVLDLDAGPVLMQREVPIQWRRSLAGTMAATRKLATEEIAVLLAEALPRILNGEVESRVVAKGPLRTIPSFRDVMVAARICRRRAGGVA